MFVAESDIPFARDGDRVRPYASSQVGFFADPELTRRVSSPAVQAGTEHERVQIVA